MDVEHRLKVEFVVLQEPGGFVYGFGDNIKHQLLTGMGTGFCTHGLLFYPCLWSRSKYLLDPTFGQAWVIRT